MVLALCGESQLEIIAVLKKHVFTFAWNPTDVKGVNLNIIIHRLNVDPIRKLIKQKKRFVTLSGLPSWCLPLIR